MSGQPGIHVFFARPNDLLQDRGHPSASDCLDEADRTHVARLRYPRDRDVAAASRILQRLAVAWAAATPPMDARALRFAKDAEGRPEVIQPDAARCLNFSASNTHGLVACAVSKAVLGLDIEPLGRELFPELLEQCCSPRELAELSSLPEESRPRRFLELWTLKEAYLKARGVGLELSPRLIGFDHEKPKGRIRLHADQSTEDSPQHWYFTQLDAGGEHVAALCVRHETQGSPIVTVWRADWAHGQLQLSMHPQ